MVKTKMPISRNHEECSDCIFKKFEPARCEGHASVPIHCEKFMEKPRVCPDDEESFGCWIDVNTEIYIKIGNLGSAHLHPCNVCKEGYGAGHDFWVLFEKYVEEIKQDRCEKEQCCCKCRFIWAEVDWSSLSIHERCCLRDKRKTGDHGLCKDFETIEMFNAKRKKRWAERRYRTIYQKAEASNNR